MNFFWVNIGTSHKFVLENSFLWAPKHGVNNKGNKFFRPGWDVVGQVKKGDIFICYNKPKIVFLGIAESDAFCQDRPDNEAFKEWVEDGRRVDIRIVPFGDAFPVDGIKPTLYKHYNEGGTYKLVSANMSIGQFYMNQLSAGTAQYILDVLGVEEILHDSNNLGPSSRADERTGESRIGASSYRVGHQKFRQEVLELWDSACAISMVRNNALLTASHILPWTQSSAKEKVDKFNGLPLTPNFDKLFDRGFISFSDNGSILISDKVDSESLKAMGVKSSIQIKLKEKNKKYLKRHRQIYGFE